MRATFVGLVSFLGLFLVAAAFDVLNTVMVDAESNALGAVRRPSPSPTGTGGGFAVAGGSA